MSQRRLLGPADKVAFITRGDGNIGQATARAFGGDRGVGSGLAGRSAQNPVGRLVGGVEQRVSAAGYEDLRGNHDCVFSHLPPQGTRIAQLATQSQMAPQTIVWHVDQLERLATSNG